MTKFEDGDDPGFIAVAGELGRWCKEVSSVAAESAVLPPLLIAAASPSTDALEHVLRITPDVNITEAGPLKRNALHFAAMSNQSKNVSVLLRAGVNMHATADGGVTPVFLACIVGHAEVVRILIEEGNEDPNVRDSKQNTLLHAAAVNGWLEVTRVLLEHGADPWAVECNGWTPLNAAVIKNREELVQILTQAMEKSSQSTCSGDEFAQEA